MPTAVPSTPDTVSNQTATPLRASNVDDNADFPGYQKYLQQFSAGGVRKQDLSERIMLQVTDSAQKGTPDALVEIASGGTTLFSGRTATDGRLVWFPRVNQAAANAQSLSVKVTKDQQSVTTTQDRGQGTWSVALPQPVDRTSAQNLDLLFCLDATGSMGDEIGRIQSTIQSVSDRIRQLNGNQKVRFGLVIYRDRVDSEPLKTFDFTENLQTFQSQLASVKADGGGDYPEDMEKGLNAALTQMSWSPTGATRLMFLVADAPPHIDYTGSVPYTDSITAAVGKGVKIYPLGASGLDATGEYVFRQMAVETLANYLFLTYGGQPGPGGGVSATVTTPVQENNLDDLIVGIVRKELAALSS